MNLPCACCELQAAYFDLINTTLTNSVLSPIQILAIACYEGIDMVNASLHRDELDLNDRLLLEAIRRSYLSEWAERN